MLLNILTLATFLLFASLGFWFVNRWRRLRGTIDDDLRVDASRGIFMGTLTATPSDGMPSILIPPDELTKSMRRAGYYHPDAASEFNTTRVFLALTCLLITGIFVVVIGPERRDLFLPIVGWGLGISALAYALPWLYVRIRGKDRVARIQRGLPDAVDMLTMCVTGGLGLQDSLGHVSREIYGSHPDLAVELEIVRRHTELTTLGDAFRQFASRVDCPEVASLSAIITQTERLGSNVVVAVREYADSVRSKQRSTADERASKAGIKLLFPLVMCLAPAALIILWGPAALELRNFFRGFNAVENQQVTAASR